MTQDDFIKAAEAAARRIGHHYVGTEHLLLAAIESPDVADVLKRLDAELTPEGVAERLIHPNTGTESPTAFVTNRSRRILERAAEQPEGFSPMQVLLVLADDSEGVAAQLIGDAGLSAEVIRRELG